VFIVAPLARRFAVGGCRRQEWQSLAVLVALARLLSVDGSELFRNMGRATYGVKASILDSLCETPVRLLDSAAEVNANDAPVAVPGRESVMAAASFPALAGALPPQ
jgi:hypothetical protein